MDGLSRALGGDVDATAVLLTADDATVDNRLRRREFGPAIEAHLARSRRAADELDALDVAIRIATDGRTPPTSRANSSPQRNGSTADLAIALRETAPRQTATTGCCSSVTQSAWSSEAART